jgi:hypothetical protein
LANLLLEQLDLVHQRFDLPEERFLERLRPPAVLKVLREGHRPPMPPLRDVVEWEEGLLDLLGGRREAVGDLRERLQDGEGHRRADVGELGGEPRAEDVQVPAQLTLGVRGLLCEAEADPAVLPVTGGVVVEGGGSVLVPFLPRELGDELGVQRVRLGLADPALFLPLEEKRVERPGSGVLLEEEGEQPEVVDATRLHRLGDRAPRRRAAERWGIVPELLDARAGVLVALGSPKEIPSNVDDGRIEGLLGDVDADVEGVLKGRLGGAGPHRSAIQSARQHRLRFPHSFLRS